MPEEEEEEKGTDRDSIEDMVRFKDRVRFRVNVLHCTAASLKLQTFRIVDMNQSQTIAWVSFIFETPAKLIPTYKFRVMGLWLVLRLCG